ncbi:MAG: hypothetical protein ACK4VI_03835 [Alphaproteobacteria bacterium]
MNTNEKDFALLQAKLVVPLVIASKLADLNNADSTMDDAEQYALHESLCEMTPDAALLSMTCSLHYIATHFEDEYPEILLLREECDYIIDQYAEGFLNNSKNALPADQRRAYEADMLDRIAEDFESLCVQMDSHLSLIAEDDSALSQMHNIFTIQADAQIMIAEEFQAAMERQKRVQVAASTPSFQGDNVVVFPGFD